MINEPSFRRRMVRYDEEGISHFYFMSLQNGVFIDATKKGNLGRFCNHSCNPNCYVDKWVVGDKLRMGIFAKRGIRAGEELVFNYNVDRYGANPQPCYCGEANCTGFIGGKTQTERATKLPIQLLQALGIEDGDDWDIAIPKRLKKKRAGEDDKDYVDRLEMKPLDENGVTGLMSALMQAREQWIVERLLVRLQRCHSDRVHNRVVRFHGYGAMKSALQVWKDNISIILQVLDVLNQFPRLTRNKIVDSKIESTLESLASECTDEQVQDGCRSLLREWNLLELGYRIPRKKRDATDTTTPDRPDRRDRRSESRDDREARKDRPSSRSRSRSPARSRPRSSDGSRGLSAPTGPRYPTNGRPAGHFDSPRRPFGARRLDHLPHGWFCAYSDGREYYYSASGQTSWTRPTMPALQPPPPPKTVSRENQLQEIIDSITGEKQRERAAQPQPAVVEVTPEPVAKPVQKSTERQEKWKSYDEEKRKKLYETTVSSKANMRLGLFDQSSHQD